MVHERSPARKPVPPEKSATREESAPVSSQDHDIDWIISGKEPVRASDFANKPWLSPPGSQSSGIEFGKPSLPNQSYGNIFNVPKSNRPRPEFHRTNPRTASRPQFRNPLEPRAQQPSRSRDSDVYEIPKPQQVPAWTANLPAYARPFSSQMAGHRTTQRVDVDLTDPAFTIDRFGAPDPYDYVDSAKATEDIKALLEGAFEDDEDKPKFRQKKRVAAEANGLVHQLAKTDLNQSVAGAAELKAEDEEEDEDEDDGSFVEGLKVKLLPHQVEGVEWMQEKETGARKIKGSLPKGGILADDMGLGKTIQSIALMLKNPPPPQQTNTSGKEGKDKLSNAIGMTTLVVAPLALIRQWESEIDLKVADSHRLRVLVHHGPTRTKRAEDLRKYDVVITTYQILVSEHDNCSDNLNAPRYGCFGVHWYRVILDEAHSIKNRNAKATKACYNLNAEFRWCLTGTPMQNNLDELQSLIRFLRIKPYNDLAVWKQQIQQPMTAGRGGMAMRRLQYYLKAFMKRRTKDVLKKDGALGVEKKNKADGSSATEFKITQRNVKKLEIDFDPRERLFYQRLEARADKSIEQMVSDADLNYASALTILLRLRQACNHPNLVTKKKFKDKDAFAIGQLGDQSDPKAKDTEHDIDGLADALGALGMSAKKCDICQIKLSDAEKLSRKIICTGCEADIGEQTDVSSHCNQLENVKKEKRGKRDETRKKRRQKNRRIIDDSDEDEEGRGGEWLVPDEERQNTKLGRAGGSDDENAECGGEWLGSDDSQTGDEDSIQILGSHRRSSGISSQERGYYSDSSDDTGAGSETDSDAHETSEDDLEPHFSSSSIAGSTTSTKIKKLLEILQKESKEHKFIVFSVFTSMLDLIEPSLKKQGLVFTRYDGSMRNDLREASLDRLRNDQKTRIMLCSLKCGSLGLNLTAASRVVLLEPFWNPFVEEQAIDRVHRLNQTVDVTVYKLTIKDTVEERIFALQERKRALAEAAIEGKSITKLSMQDILNLFKHDHGPDETIGKSQNEFSTKSRVLHDPRGEQSSFRKTQDGRKVTPSEARKPRPAGPSVYGRRW